MAFAFIHYILLLDELFFTTVKRFGRLFQSRISRHIALHYVYILQYNVGTPYILVYINNIVNVKYIARGEAVRCLIFFFIYKW